MTNNKTKDKINPEIQVKYYLNIDIIEYGNNDGRPVTRRGKKHEATIEKFKNQKVRNEHQMLVAILKKPGIQKMLCTPVTTSGLKKPDSLAEVTFGDHGDQRLCFGYLIMEDRIRLSVTAIGDVGFDSSAIGDAITSMQKEMLGG